MIPSFIEDLEARGVIIPRDMFSNDPKAVATGPQNQGAKGTPAMPGNMANLMKKTGTTGGKP